MALVHELKKQIADLNSRVFVIQSECGHPKHCRKVDVGSGTGDGNTFESDWNVITCRLCEKTWEELRKGINHG